MQTKKVQLLEVGDTLRNGYATMVIAEITVSIESAPETMISYDYQDLEGIPKARQTNAREIIELVLYGGWKVQPKGEVNEKDNSQGVTERMD